MFGYFLLGTIVFHLATAVPQIYPGLQEVDINFDDTEQAVEDVDSNGASVDPSEGRQIGVDLIPNLLPINLLGNGDDDADCGDDAAASSCTYGTSKITQFADLKSKLKGLAPFTLDSLFGTTLLSMGGIAMTAVAVLGGLAAFGFLPVAGLGTVLTTAIGGLGLGDAFAREGFGFDNSQNHIHAQNEYHQQFQEKAQHKFDDYYHHQQ